MTSNERKILEYIWNRGGEAHVQLISSKLGFGSDYSHSLCRALKKAGHLEFSGRNFCRLSEKGHKYFSILRSRATAEDGQDHDNIGVIATSSLPQEELTDDPTLSDKDDELDEEEKIEEIGHDEEGTEKLTANPIDNVGLMIKRFVGFFKESIKPSSSGHATHGITRNK